jgi:hypothetical protein
MELPAKRDPDAFLMLLSTLASPVSGVFCSSVSGTVTRLLVVARVTDSRRLCSSVTTFQKDYTNPFQWLS